MAAKMADIAVKGGILVGSKGMKPGGIFIRDGLIDSIEPSGRKLASRVIDASGKFVLPGIIDAHNHPVYADRINTLSQSAAYGFYRLHGVKAVIKEEANKLFGAHEKSFIIKNLGEAKNMRSLWSKVLASILGVTSCWDSLAPIRYDKKELKIVGGVVLSLLALGIIGIVLIEM